MTMSLLAPFLTSENSNEILPKVMNQPTRKVEKVLEEHFPESKRKEQSPKIEWDGELQSLLEEAKLLASEKDFTELLKKVLRSYVRERKTRGSLVKRHTRYVQRHTAREVKQRDGFQCAYVSPKGIRCNQRAHLQIDHIRPYAKGGSSHDMENLRCLCRAHNLFLAKQDFPTASRARSSA
jgi:hypothetical protein